MSDSVAGVQVALLFICDTVNCAFDISFLYIPLVNNFGLYPTLCSIARMLTFFDRQSVIVDVCYLGYVLPILSYISHD